MNTKADKRILVRAVLGGVVVILLGAGAIAGRNGSFWVFSFQGWGGIVALAGGFFLTSAVALLWTRRGGQPNRAVDWLFDDGHRTHGVLWATAAAISSGIFLWIFRLRLFLRPPQGLGDSLQLIEHVPAYAHVFGYLDSFDEALDLFLHSRLFLWIEKSFHGTIIDAYAWPSIAAGVVYTLVLTRFLWGRPRAHVALGFFLLYFNTALQLYAGYVENYTFATLLLSTTLLAGGRSLERETGRRLILVIALSLSAAFGVLFHLIVGAILPGLVYLCWIWADRDPKRFVRLAVLASIPALLVLACGWLLFFKVLENPLTISGSFASHPALLHPRKILSIAHTIDYAGLYLFAAPGALIVLLIFFGRPASQVGAGRSGFLAAPHERFAVVTLLVLAAHAFVWNSMIGFPADWDLFTFFQAPLNLFAFYVFIRPFPDDRHIKAATLAAVASLSLSWSLPWIVRNARETPASMANVERATSISRIVAARVRKDGSFARVADLERRRTWLKLELFQERARGTIAAASWPEPQKEQMLQRLEAAGQRFREIAVLEKGAYERLLPPVWEELTVVNETVTAEEQKRDRER